MSSRALTPKIILASSSPRRIEMLKLLGMRIEVAPAAIDETPRKNETPRALVRRLARAKAEAVSKGRRAPHLVISADTIVVSPKGRILGKPRNVREAREMLKELSGRHHTVLTGYCLLSGASPECSLVRVCSTRVRMRKLSESEIRAYVSTGEPMDKAGSYAVQGIGMSLVETVSGSHSNVVGLPAAQLVLDLERSFGITPFSWLEKKGARS